jgi:hypothetical protein
MRLRGAIAWALCFSAGCAANVQTRFDPLPAATAPPAERVAAYDRLRPKIAAAGDLCGAAKPLPALVLADGRAVCSLGDFETILPRDSETLTAMDNASRSAAVQNVLGWGGLGVAVLGPLIPLALSPKCYADSRDRFGNPIPQDPNLSCTGNHVAFLSLLAGGLGLSLVAIFGMGGDVAAESFKAMASVDGDLQRTLGLCLTADPTADPVPCEVPTSTLAAR